MSRLDNSRQFLVCLAIPALIAAPAIAHNVQVSGDVAATFHLEPNHNPKVNQPARTWFALTRRGGEIIPLAKCNCYLAVYATPRSTNAVPLMRPTLKATSAERYKGIPGAEITFPRSGIYELELVGSPKPGANFKPFTFTYQVTVSR